MRILFLSALIFFNGCLAFVSKDEMVIKKKDVALIEKNCWRLISSEECYIINKEDWKLSELIELSNSSFINTECMSLFGTYKGLKDIELVNYSKKGRLIKEVEAKIKKELEKRRLK